MSLRYALVTGGNKGIGFEICKQLASKNVLVILTSRNVQRGNEAVQKLKTCGLAEKVMFHQLDVTDAASVDALAAFVTTRFGKLDILPYETQVDWSELAIQTYEMAEECLKTNYHGATLMTKALLPLLQLSDSPRIINISSILGSLELISNEWAKRIFSDTENLTEDQINLVLDKFLKDFKHNSLKPNGWPTATSAYTLSKAALNAYTRMIAKTYPDILTYSVHPGYVKTDITLNTGELTAEEAAVFSVKLAVMADGAASGLFYYEGNVCPF